MGWGWAEGGCVIGEFCGRAQWKREMCLCLFAHKNIILTKCVLKGAVEGSGGGGELLLKNIQAPHDLNTSNLSAFSQCIPTL